MEKIFSKQQPDRLLHIVVRKSDLIPGRVEVVQNDKFLRPEELPYLKGDSTRIRELGWKPEYTFESMMDEMIDFWMEILQK